MENEIIELAHLYWEGEIDTVDEQYAAMVINYIWEHPDEFGGAHGM